MVSGLGSIGLLTSQLLQAHGCRVLGLDPDPQKCDLAASLGIQSFNPSCGADPVSWCHSNTNGLGVDGVIITAATSSSQPVNQAAQPAVSVGVLFLWVLQVWKLM